MQNLLRIKFGRWYNYGLNISFSPFDQTLTIAVISWYLSITIQPAKIALRVPLEDKTHRTYGVTTKSHVGLMEWTRAKGPRE